MFKVIGYLEEWEDLYISHQASRNLAAYRGAEGVRSGIDGKFQITELGYAKSDSRERPRLVQLFTSADLPWAGFLIGNYLRSRAASEISEMLKGGDRSSLSNEISSLFRICEEIDSHLSRGAWDQMAVDPTEEARTKKTVRTRQSKVTVASVAISLTALAATLFLGSRVNNLKKNHEEALKNFDSLVETNRILSSSNKSLAREIERLSGQKRELDSDIKRLRKNAADLDEKNQLIRGELWPELAERNILSVLESHERSISKRQISEEVQRLIPLNSATIEKSLEALVTKGMVGTDGFTSTGYYLKSR